eukprot:gene2581-3543_t
MKHLFALDLSVAIRKREVEELQKLLIQGLDINEQIDYPVGCYITNDKRAYGESIPWTALQYAAASGYQDVIDFLVENGADTTIQDKCNRTAQQIADLLNRNVDVQKWNKEQEKKENEKSVEQKEIEKKKKEEEEILKKFDEFISQPIEFFKKLKVSYNSKKQHFEVFLNKYQKFAKNIDGNDYLENIMIERLEKSKDSKMIEVLSDSLRKSYKQKFIEVVSESKKKLGLPKKLGIKLSLLVYDKAEEFPDLNEEQLYQLIYEDEFIEWSENKSEFMKEFDELVGFDGLSGMDSQPNIFKAIRSGEISGIDYSQFFPELEQFFGTMKKYFGDDSMEVFLKLTNENESLKQQIEILKGGKK